MVVRETTVPGLDGFHMRSAALLADRLSAYESDVTILHNGNQVNAKSMLELMAACMRHGDRITVTAIGYDELEALDAALAAIEDSRMICTV